MSTERDTGEIKATVQRIEQRVDDTADSLLCLNQRVEAMEHSVDRAVASIERLASAIDDRWSWVVRLVEALTPGRVIALAGAGAVLAVSIGMADPEDIARVLPTAKVPAIAEEEGTTPSP